VVVFLSQFTRPGLQMSYDGDAVAHGDVSLQKPWGDHSTLMLAAGLVGVLLSLQCLLFLFSRRPTRPRSVASRSLGDGFDGDASPGGEEEVFSLGAFVWKTLRLRRQLSEEAPQASLLDAFRLTFERRGVDPTFEKRRGRS